MYINMLYNNNKIIKFIIFKNRKKILIVTTLFISLKIIRLNNIYLKPRVGVGVFFTLNIFKPKIKLQLVKFHLSVSTSPGN